MKELVDYIQSQVNIGEEDMVIILSKFKEKRVAKNKFLLRVGQTATSYYFVKSGGLRIYLNEKEEETTGWVAFEGEFFTELSSLKTHSPTRFNIQAIEDSTLLTIKSEDMEWLYARFPSWQQFGRLVWEMAFLKVLDGIISHQTMTAEERYLAVMAQTDLLQRIPLKDLSSFLGIKASSLSRIRKNLK